MDLVCAVPLRNPLKHQPAHTCESVLAVEGEDYCLYLADDRELSDPDAGATHCYCGSGRVQQYLCFCSAPKVQYSLEKGGLAMTSEYTPNTRAVTFDLQALISRAWDIFRLNLGVLLPISVVFIIIFAALGSVTKGAGSIVLSGPMSLGMAIVALRAARGQQIEIPMMFWGFQRFLPAFLAGLVLAAFTIVGFALCVIPGFIVGFLYMLTYFYMADKNLDFWPAMEASRVAAAANIWPWVTVLLVCIAINSAGLLLCCIGSIFTFPLSFVFLALAYDQLEGSPANAEDASSMPPPLEV
jgi:uncharacterized membrane protein